MAIRKEITTVQEITCNAYIMIASYSFNKINKGLSFDVWAFYGKEAREKFAQPIQTWSFCLNGEEYDQWITSTNEQECLYYFIKTLPEFAGAEDLI